MVRKVINRTFKTYYNLRMRRIERYMKHPLEAQEGIFQQLLWSAKHTEWGKRFGYKHIRSMEQYAQQVPIQKYEDLQPYIERMMHGERHVLWNGRTRWFSKSSGTTSNRSKFIPVSKENLEGCHTRGNWDAMTLLYNQRPDARIFELRTLIMAGHWKRFEPFSKTKIGDVSAIMIERMPNIGKPFLAPDFETALMADFEAKIERTARLSSQQPDIVSIAGVPTWVMVLFKRVLELTGKDNILEVWPDFQFYIHGGVSFTPYHSQFEQLLPSDQVSYQEIYNASEGYFGIQSDLSQKDMLLLLANGIYYEFIPMEEWESDSPKTVNLADVEIGKPYAIVISTNAGLWRYTPGDTVQFTSTNPYKFKIIGRTKQYINTFGEEVIVENTDQAMTYTCQQTGAVVQDYTAAPIYMEGGKGGHEWLVEFNKRPQNMERFINLLDKHLQQINSDYEAKRYKDMALERLTLHPIPKGTFQQWMKSKGRSGSQVKVPRLANNRAYVEEVMAFLGKWDKWEVKA
ncbi:MAG: GH3 auxin-responsive promoter family protein [Bacteroidota bacterium]